MDKKISTYFVDLVKDAVLKAFWRIQALKTFLKQHGISDSYLSSWSSDETKRIFLARLFDNISGLQGKKFHSIILNIANSLAEMKSFPDLENWEDSSEKISKAHTAIEKLKIKLNEYKRKVVDEGRARENREKAYAEKQKNIQFGQSLKKLQTKLEEMLLLQGTADGGYAFEDWLYELATFSEIQARKPYRDKNNRGLDGSLTLDGTNFLVETKFQKEKIGSQDIDLFYGKITRKADNTMGIMLSMSGFNDNAIEAASRDRTPIILMDYSHLYQLVFPRRMVLPDVIRRIWRNASHTGVAFLKVKDFSR